MSNRSHTKPIVNTLSGKSVIGEPTDILNTLQYDAVNDVFNLFLHTKVVLHHLFRVQQ